MYPTSSPCQAHDTSIAEAKIARLENVKHVESKIII